MHSIPFFPFSASLGIRVESYAFQPSAAATVAVRRRFTFIPPSAERADISDPRFLFVEGTCDCEGNNTTLHQPADDSSLEWFLNASNSTLSFDDKLILYVRNSEE
jgi:hypothetical protein